MTSNENLYVIYCVDAPCEQTVEDPHGGRRKGGLHRMSCLDEHNAYQLATSSPGHDCYIHKVTVAPMLGADGVTIIGSCFLVKSTREAAERFIASDPLCKKQVWESVSINRFSGAAKAQDDPWAGTTKAKAATAAHLYQPRRV